jgi:hypothetical protein
MREMQPTNEGQFKFPEDLRAWMGERELLKLAFEALHVLEEGSEMSPDAARPEPGAPRVLLTLLTYCYAAGIYSSDEIEAQVPNDPQLAYLCAKTLPLANRLRHFRRYHREFVVKSLSELLQLAWKSHPQNCGPLRAAHDTRQFESFFRRAAEQRVQEAILEDTMALDD